MIKETVAVYIGRFQPFHKGHLSTFRHAFKHYNHIIALLGSVDEPRTIKNPFSESERDEMITSSLLSLQTVSN